MKMDATVRTEIMSAGLKLAIADQTQYQVLIAVLKDVDQALQDLVVGTDDHDELLRAQGAARHHRELLATLANVFKRPPQSELMGSDTGNRFARSQFDPDL